MCGIIGIFNLNGITKEDIKHLVFMLTRCQVRGTDASGFYNSRGEVIKAPGPADNFLADKEVMEWLVNCEGLKYVVGHTRAATRGSPQFNRNNHPLLNLEKKFMVVHNGIARHHEYDKDREVTDSYIFIHAIEDLLKKEKQPFFNAVRRTIAEVTGMNAIVVGSPKELVLARSTGRPLQIHVDKKNGVIQRAFFGSTEEIIGIKGCKSIKNNFVFAIDVETGTPYSGRTIKKDATKDVQLTLTAGTARPTNGGNQALMPEECYESLANTEICRHCKKMNLRRAKRKRCYCKELDNWFDPDTPICDPKLFLHYRKSKRQKKLKTVPKLEISNNPKSKNKGGIKKKTKSQKKIDKKKDKKNKKIVVRGGKIE